MGLSTILTSSAPSHSALVRLLHVLFCTFNKNNFSGCFTISFLCACLHFLSSHSFLCKNKLYIFNSSTNNKEHTTTKLGLCQREMRFSFVFPPKDRSTVFMTSQRATRQVVRQHYTTRLSATTRKWLQGYFFVRLSELRQLTGLPRYLLLPAAWRLEVRITEHLAAQLKPWILLMMLYHGRG